MVQRIHRPTFLLILIVILTTPNIRHSRAASSQQFDKSCSPNGVIYDAEFSPDGKYILTTWDTGTARLWVTQTGKVARSFSIKSMAPDSHITSVAFSPRGDFIATGSDRGLTVIWSLQTGEKIQAFSPEIVRAEGFYSVRTLNFTPDGKYVFTGDDLRGRLWNVQTGEILRVFPSGESEGVDESYLSPDGKYVLTDNRLWDTQTGQLLHTFENAARAGYSSNGKFVLTWEEDMRLWDVSSYKNISSFDMPAPRWKFSPGDLYLFTYDQYALILSDVKTGKPLHEWIFENHPVNSATFSADGKYLLFTDDTVIESDFPLRTVVVWDIAKDVEVRRFNIYLPALLFEVSPDSKYLLLGAGGDVPYYG